MATRSSTSCAAAATTASVTALDAGDRCNEYGVEYACLSRQLLPGVYTADSTGQPDRRLDVFLAYADDVEVAEVSRLARTLRRWRSRIVAYHHRRLFNGRTQPTITLIKRIKPLAIVFRNFHNHRLRLLLHCDLTWHTPPTAKIRAHKPAFTA